MKLNDLFANHQYIAWDNGYGCGITDLGNEEVFSELCEKVESTTLRKLQEENSGLYKAIKRGGADGVDEDEEIEVYKTDEFYVYVCDFWQ